MSEYKPKPSQEAVSLPSDTSPPTHLPSVSEQMVAVGVRVLDDLQGEVSKVTLVEQLYLAMARADPSRVS